jgi:hypothetical protein
MAALIFFLLSLGGSIFKSNSRLESRERRIEATADCAAAKDTRSGPVHEQRSPVLHPVVSLVSISPQCHHDHQARNPGAMASCRFSPLLALEMSKPGRPTANRCGFAGIDPSDER